MTEDESSKQSEIPPTQDEEEGQEDVTMIRGPIRKRVAERFVSTIGEITLILWLCLRRIRRGLMLEGFVKIWNHLWKPMATVVAFGSFGRRIGLRWKSWGTMSNPLTCLWSTRALLRRGGGSYDLHSLPLSKIATIRLSLETTSTASCAPAGQANHLHLIDMGFSGPKFTWERV
ncbi:hypothetical protein V2J09_018324 [Rumex salicifolius]